MSLNKQIRIEDILREKKRYLENKKVKTKKKELNIFDTLNEEQRQAVLSNKKNTLIIASAGTGKTSTIIARVVKLLKDGVKPNEIVLLTFTQKAGQEMLERLEKYFSQDIVGEIFAGTFHSYGAKLLKKLNIDRKLKTPKEIMLFFDYIIEQFEDEKSENFQSSKTILDYIYLYENTNENEDFSTWLEKKLIIQRENTDNKEIIKKIDEYLSNLGTYQRIYTAFCIGKKENKICDFNDLLKVISYYYEKNQNTLKHIIVDEYQDTNNLQNRILKSLEESGSSIFAVGDYDQSIYGFNGSNVYLIKDFFSNYGGSSKVGIYKLCKNYRSSDKICEVANTFISKNERIIEKELIAMKKGNFNKPKVLSYFNREEQIEEISSLIVEYMENGVSLNDIAILFRTNNTGSLIEPVLIKNNIPTVRTKNAGFFEAEDIASLVSVIKIVTQKDKSIMDYLYLSKLIEGISKEECKKLYSLKMKYDDVAQSFIEFNNMELKKPTNINIEIWKDFYSFVMEAKDIHNIFTIFKLLYETKAYKYLIDNYISKVSKISKDKVDYEIAKQIEDKHNLLLQIAQSSKNINSFLLKTTFSSNEDDEEGYGVHLLTVHLSKGLEYKIVFIVDLVEDIFPNTRLANQGAGIEEERRLMYVALTRAKEELYLCYFKNDDKKKELVKSRFINECNLSL